MNEFSKMLWSFCFWLWYFYTEIVTFLQKNQLLVSKKLTKFDRDSLTGTRGNHNFTRTGASLQCIAYGQHTEMIHDFIPLKIRI